MFAADGTYEHFDPYKNDQGSSSNMCFCDQEALRREHYEQRGGNPFDGAAGYFQPVGNGPNLPSIL